MSTSSPSWSGPFPALIEEVNRRLSAQSLAPLSSRSIRHYQQSGVIGRGIKQGREAYFDERDVQALLDARSYLSEGLGLKHIAKINQSSHYSSHPFEPSCRAVRDEQGAATFHHSPHDELKKSASSLPLDPVQLVAKLLQKQEPNHHPSFNAPPASRNPILLAQAASTTFDANMSHPRTKSSPAGALRAASASLDMNRLPPGTTSTLYSPFGSPSWLTVQMQVEAAEKASDAERQRAIALLEEMIAALKRSKGS